MEMASKHVFPAPSVVSTCSRCLINGSWINEQMFVLCVLQWKDSNPSCSFVFIMGIVQKRSRVCFKI